MAPRRWSGLVAMLVVWSGCSGTTHDVGSADAGTDDAGVMDAGVVDAGVADAGTADAGSDDAGVVDAGVADAGAADAGMTCPPGTTWDGQFCTTPCETFGPPPIPNGCECGDTTVTRCFAESVHCGECDAGLTCSASNTCVSDGG